MPQDRTKGGDAITGLLLVTFRLNGNFLEAADRISAPSNLTAARWQILGSVLQEAKTVSQIAREMGLARQSVQRIANILVGEGHLELTENPAHKRAKLITVTQQGRASIYSLSERQHIWANTIAEGFDSQELALAVQLLRRVSSQLEAMEKTPTK
ncbi:MAG: DNA-binding MarR family transcriptional regulator [Paracoccaceae bacterium]|jgi:DNA-binding MarR family transcriptional regulator